MSIENDPNALPMSNQLQAKLKEKEKQNLVTYLKTLPEGKSYKLDASKYTKQDVAEIRNILNSICASTYEYTYHEAINCFELGNIGSNKPKRSANVLDTSPQLKHISQMSFEELAAEERRLAEPNKAIQVKMPYEELEQLANNDLPQLAELITALGENCSTVSVFGRYNEAYLRNTCSQIGRTHNRNFSVRKHTELGFFEIHRKPDKEITTNPVQATEATQQNKMTDEELSEFIAATVAEAHLEHLNNPRPPLTWTSD